MRKIIAECAHAADSVLGEGPVWDGDLHRLWWVDIEQKEIHQWDPASGRDVFWDLPHRVGFVIPTTRGDCVIGTQSGLARFSPGSGGFEPLKNPEEHLPDNRFNDAKCDAAGRLWAGTMAVSEVVGQGSLYRIEPNLEIQQMVSGISISNGLAWSADSRLLYYVDSPTRRVDAFDFDLRKGTLGGRRPIIRIPQGFPDGMCIDAAGNLWIALWGGWGVACHDPRTGECLARIEVPVRDVTSCCFGGRDLDVLYITTASRDLDQTGKAQQPLAGSVFVARPGVRGTPACKFAG